MRVKGQGGREEEGGDTHLGRPAAPTPIAYIAGPSPSRLLPLAALAPSHSPRAALGRSDARRARPCCALSITLSRLPRQPHCPIRGRSEASTTAYTAAPTIHPLVSQ